MCQFGNGVAKPLNALPFPNLQIDLFANYFFSLSSFSIEFAADDNTDSIKLKINAHKKLSTLISSINLSAIMMIRAFITKRKSPSVRSVTGSVSKINRGFTNTFNTANTKAKITAVLKSKICTPLKSEDNP